MKREIRFLVHPGFQLLDLSGPLAAFQVANNLAGGTPYRLRVVSRHGGAIGSSSGVEIITESADDARFDTLVVIGGGPSRCAAGVSDEARIAAACAPEIRRTTSVCTGAFTLANAGLLDGRHATTHWQYAALLQRLFPRVTVDGDRIFTRDGSVWTSAGISAWIDLALALIEDDLGADLSRATARMLIVYYRRPGGQSQFSTLLDLEPQSERIRKVLSYVREHLHEQLTAERLADIACLSPRQFTRTFVAETGKRPRVRSNACAPNWHGNGSSAAPTRSRRSRARSGSWIPNGCAGPFCSASDFPPRTSDAWRGFRDAPCAGSCVGP